MLDAFYRRQDANQGHDANRYDQGRENGPEQVAPDGPQPFLDVFYYYHILIAWYIPNKRISVIKSGVYVFKVRTYF
jgi:hypothetical protein